MTPTRSTVRRPAGNCPSIGSRGSASFLWALVLVLFGLPLMLVPTARAADGPAVVRDHAYDYDLRGTAVGLSLEVARIAIQLDDADARSERLPEAARAALAATGNFDLDAATPATDRGLWFLPLRSAGGESAIAAALASAGEIAGLRFAAPVLRNGETTIVPTDRILVTIDADRAGAALEALAARAELTWEREFPGAQPIHRFHLDAPVDGLRGRLRALSALPGVIAAEPDSIQIRGLRATPDDPFLGSQWFLRNTGQVGTPGADSRAADAWSAETGSPTITVAVIDTGVDVAHPDLVAQLVPGHDATTANPPGGVPGNHDGDGHGTACAGIIGATGNNALGVSGICWDVSIQPVRIFSNAPNGSAVTTDSWIIDALTWAADNGADILSNSWGGGAPSTAIENAIQYGIDNGRGGLGCVPVFAAGNDNTVVEFPAAYPNAMAIGASSPCDERKSPTSCDGENFWGSNFGTDLDIVAPGVLIATTDISGAGGYVAGDYFAGFNGTSSATPLVAGAAALLLSADPSLTYAQVRTFLRDGADDEVGPAGVDTPGFDTQFGFGRLNAARSLELVLGVDGPTVTGCTESAPNEVTITWTNGQTYDAIELRQGGALIQTLAGTATTTTIAGLTDPLVLFDVNGVIGGTPTVSSRCDIVLLGGTTDLVWSPAAGTVDGGTAIADALVANGHSVLVTGSLGVIADLDAFERIWVNLGVFPSNSVLGSADAARLQDYLTNGVGGSFLYMEGADTWFFDAQTPLHALFAVNATSDGSGDLTTVIGTGAAACDLTGIDLVYTGENSFIDRLGPGAGAVAIQSNDAPGYDCAIFNDGGTFRTVAASYELGGFFDGASTRADLVGALLGCSGSGFVPPVNTLVCGPVGGDASLAWSNPGGYDAIEVDRDGVTIATLAGGATSFTDPAIGAGTTAYAVRGVVGGVPSTAATCSVSIAPGAVTALVCGATGADVTLTWAPPGDADTVAVLRDGIEIALLPGGATGTTDGAVPGGTHAYSVVARAGTVDAPSADCSVDVAPAALTGLACGEIAGFIQLTWTNHETYDALIVTRDGLPFATLPGTVTSTLDDTATAGSHDYTVTPRIDAVDGPTASCTVALPPAGIIGLACSGGELSASLSWALGDTYDAIDVLRDGALLETLPGGATATTDTTATVGSHTYAVVGRTGGVDAGPASCGVIVSPAAVTGLACTGGVATANLTWSNGMAYTSIEVRRDGNLIAVLGGTVTTFDDAAAPVGTVAYEVLGRVAGLASAPDTCTAAVALPPITVFTCNLVAGAGALAWTNPTAYDTIEVRRDGVLIATLPGTDTNSLDLEAPGGNHVYELTPTSGAVSATPISCALAVTPKSATGVSASITDACTRATLLTWANAEPADAIEILRDGVLVETLPTGSTSTTMALPTDGTYALCVRPVIDGLPAVDACAGVTSTPVSTAAVTGLVCVVDDATCTATISWDAHATATSLTVLVDGLLDQTLPGTATSATLTLPVGVVATIEVGGTNLCGNPLAGSSCTTGCTPPVTFVRGDANADGAFDISDPIRTLQVLFEGVPTPCAAALDTNDDDAVDISDVIAGLGGIFGGGTPPGAPFPACGEDPTPGALTCDTFPICP